jgi:nucleoside-diphosphate-sugar epimerase
VHPDAAGMVFNAGRAEAEANAAWAARLADVLGWRGEVRRLPRRQVPEPARAPLAALDLGVPLVMETALIRERLGYREVTDLAEALRRTAEDERARAG